MVRGGYYNYWCIGFKRWGKHSEESKFYNHLLSLIPFLFLSKDMWHHFALWSSTPGWVVPILQIDSQIPEMWVWVSLNVAAQYPFLQLCSLSKLLSLTVQMALYIRRLHFDESHERTNRYFATHTEKIFEPTFQRMVLWQSFYYGTLDWCSLRFRWRHIVQVII